MGLTVSEVIKCLDSEVFQNTSNLNKVCFTQQSSNSPSGIPSREGEKGSKMTKTIEITSSGLKRTAGWLIKKNQNMLYLLNFC